MDVAGNGHMHTYLTAEDIAIKHRKPLACRMMMDDAAAAPYTAADCKLVSSGAFTRIELTRMDTMLVEAGMRADDHKEWPDDVPGYSEQMLRR